MDIYFDKIFIINLNRRPDRWSKMEQKMKKYGITNYTRVEAVDGELCQNKIHAKHQIFCKMIQNSIDSKRTPLLKGEVGLILSTIEVLKIAIKNNYKRILLLDDDIVFHKNFHKEFNRIVKPLDGWKLLYLGTTCAYTRQFVVNNNIATFPKDIKRFWGTYAYGIDSSIYKEYMLLLLNSLTPLDSEPIHTLLRKYNEDCYLVCPYLMIADVADKSDIRNISYNLEYYAKVYNWNTALYDYDI